MKHSKLMKMLPCPACKREIAETQTSCPFCRRIVALSAEAAKFVPSSMSCPGCRFENPYFFRFCGECGAKLMEKCPTCGQEAQAHMLFCGKCGTPLSEIQHLAQSTISTVLPDSPSVLVVDDEPHITQLVQHLFELEGVKANVAPSVKEALELISREKPSVIITDMMMPGTNGNEFIQILKKNQETQNIKIIVLTVVDAFEEIRRSVLLGADDYICKPFDPQELLWSVQRLLGQFQSTKGQAEKAFD